MGKRTEEAFCQEYSEIGAVFQGKQRDLGRFHDGEKENFLRAVMARILKFRRNI